MVVYHGSAACANVGFYTGRWEMIIIVIGIIMAAMIPLLFGISVVMLLLAILRHIGAR